MYKEILVPLDGSPLAEQALTAAKGIVAALGANLTLLRVIPESDASDGVQALEARQEAETYVANIANQIGGASVKTAVRAGHAAPAILAEVEERGIDLIAMSTHGRSGLGRWIYGSVADDVMRHAPVPVILVSGTSAAREWPKDRTPRILVPLDYSQLSEAVLDPVKDLARGTGAELILVSVTPLLLTMDTFTGVGYLAYDIDQDEVDRRKYLDEVAAKLRADGFTVTTRVEFGSPNEFIVDVARETKADLVAMSTHGSGGVTRLLMGSVATGVVQRANTPVLIVRPTEVREQEVGGSAQVHENRSPAG